MLQQLTELDAVNEMLLSIGQTPVNTLATSGIRDVNIAKTELTKVSRNVQLMGWNFNTDDSYELTPTIDKIIEVPPGVLRIDAVDPTANLVPRKHPQRGTVCLWNKDDNTWEFDAPVTCKIVWGYEFADLPPACAAYVSLSAARKFQKRVIGSDTLDGFNAEDEQRAWATFLRDERGSRDTNLFRANSTLASQTNSRRY